MQHRAHAFIENGAGIVVGALAALFDDHVALGCKVFRCSRRLRMRSASICMTSSSRSRAMRS